jgi:hypothetical protein
LLLILRIISKETALIDVSVVHKRNGQTEKVSLLESEKGEINLHHILQHTWCSLVALC